MIAHPRDLDFRAGQINVRRDDKKVLEPRGQHLLRDGIFA
jgi:hypothetical protein